MPTPNFPAAIQYCVEQLIQAENEFRTKCGQRLLAAGYDPATTVLDIDTQVEYTVDGEDPLTDAGWSRSVRVTMTPRVTILPPPG